MSRRSLDLTLEFIRQLDQSTCPANVCSVLLGVASRFGAEHVLAGTIPVPGAGKRQQREHIILEHWPTGWTERYFSQGYLFRDPAIRRVTSSTEPFSWSELEPLCRDNPAARRVMDEAGDFRLRSGFTVPLLTLDGTVAGFSFAGERLDIDPDHRAILSLLATYALGQALMLNNRRSEPANSLAPRECVALRWAAEGKTDWEIAHLMGISAHGVDRHMRFARHKLGASNRAHAVAEAIRRGIIR